MKVKRFFRSEQIIICALFIALISVGSFIRIPLPTVPITLQFLLVMLAAHILNPISAFVCIFCYIIIGLLGIPVFSGGGGIGYVLTPTFGYIIGFLFGALLISFLVHKKKSPSFKYLLLSNFAGYAVVYIFGLLYYYLLNVFYFGNYISLWPMLLSCFVIFIPTDIAFCVISAFISKRIRPVLRG